MKIRILILINLISSSVVAIPGYCDGETNQSIFSSSDISLNASMNEENQKGCTISASQDFGFGLMDVNMYMSEDSAYDYNFRLSKETEKKNLFVDIGMMNKTDYLKDTVLFKAGFIIVGKNWNTF